MKRGRMSRIFACFGKSDAARATLLFEPDVAPLPMIHSVPQVIEHPEIQPTIVDLEEAELRARLALHEANAESVEQVAITQSSTYVQVMATVDTSERKRAVQNSLRGLAFVRASIHSIEEMSPPTNANSLSNFQTQDNSGAYESPLQIYLVRKSATAEQVAEGSRKMREAALAIQAQSRAINSLDAKFSTSERSRLTPVGWCILAELFVRQKKSLTSGIAREQSLVDLWVQRAAPQPGPVRNAYEQLGQQAAKNKDLCDELLATEKKAQRSADQILLEMRRSLDHMAILVANLDTTPTDARR